MTSLTYEDVRQQLRYEPDTGRFIRLTATSSKTAVGDIAGHVNQRGYRVISIGGKQYRSHRLAFLYMVGRWPLNQMDHIDGDKDNNRWANLREATHAQNQRNRGQRIDNSSGFKGVTWIDHGDTSWRAQIRSNGGETRFAGNHRTREEAARAYDKAALALHGEFAVTNESLGLLPPLQVKDTAP